MDSTDIPRNGKLESDPARVHMGYILSLVSGILIVMQGAVGILFRRWRLFQIFLGIGEFRERSLTSSSIVVLAIVTMILGVVILFGALLIHFGRVREGAITVLAFAILSVFTGGGYIAGLIIGVIGGALVLSKG